MLSFTRGVRKERAELTYTSLHAAHPVTPQCYRLEIHTVRATPDHYGSLYMAMDQSTLGKPAESSHGSQPCLSKPSLLHPSIPLPVFSVSVLLV